MTVLGKRSIPQIVAYVTNLIVETLDCQRPKRILQNTPLTSVVGIVCGAQHTSGLRVDANAESVSPLFGPAQHIQNIGVATDNKERRIMRFFDM